MGVKLRKRKNKDGSTTLLLDVFHNGERKYEFLSEQKLLKATTTEQKQRNKEKQAVAESIAALRHAQLTEGDTSFINNTGNKTIITTWMQAYIDGYDKKDKRNMQGVLNRFSDFLLSLKKQSLTFGQIDALLIEDFIGYLEKNSKGEGASSYFARFKKMLKHAYRRKMIKENILDRVEKTPKGKAAKKDVLTIDEIKILAGTPLDSSEVRRAFLFCTVTGLRWIDVNSLKWDNVDIGNKLMKVVQSKTGETVTIPLNTVSIQLLGIPGEGYVFTLPTANGANKTLKAWVKRAGINKKITWHNARHSYGTNLIFNDVDVLTASKMLGHTSLKHTQRYVNTAEEMKRTAADKINFEL